MAFDETIKAGATSKIIEVMVRDSTTGQGKTGLAFGSITASYVREGGTRTAITLITGTAGDAYSSGKWAEVDATNTRGLYQLHIPNAAIAAGVQSVTVTLKATGMIDKVVRIGLVGLDLRDTVRGGMTSLPAASPAANGGLPTVDANNRVAEIADIKTITDLLPNGGALNDLTTLVSRLTAARAGFLDFLNVGGLVASQAGLLGITQAQRIRVTPPSQMERPDSGSITFRVYIYSYNEQNESEDLDLNPTVTAENNAATDRSSNVGAIVKPATGVYYFDYTVADTHAIEGLVFKVDATEGGVTTPYAASSIVVDTTAVDFTAADRLILQAITDGIGVAGDGLTSIPWNPAWDTEVQSECVDALIQYDAAVGSAVTSAQTTIITLIGTTNSGINSISSQTTAILEDTGELQTKFIPMLVLDGSVYQFTANALELGPAGGGGGGQTFITTPLGVEIHPHEIASSIGGVRFTHSRFKETKDSIPFKVVDGNGAPLDMTSDDFEFSIIDSTGTAVLEKASPDAQITLAASDPGAPSVLDIVMVTVESNQVNAIGIYTAIVRNLTLEVVIGEGRYEVKAAHKQP